MIVGGLILSTLGGFVLHVIPGRVLLVFFGHGFDRFNALVRFGSRGSNGHLLFLGKYPNPGSPPQVLTHVAVRFSAQ